MIVVASAGIGTSLRLRLNDHWHEFCCLWGFNVGVSGVTKTPVTNWVVGPLWAVEDRLVRESAEALHEWEAEKGRKPEEGEEGEPRGPRPPAKRAIISEVTKEAVAPILVDNPRGLLLTREEGAGWIKSFNEYKSGKGSDREFWLATHSGAPISTDRKGSNNGRAEHTHVPRPFVSVLTNLVPGSLDLLVDEKRESGGFTERICFAFPDSIPTRVWQEDSIPEADIRRWEGTINRLAGMPFKDNNDGTFGPWEVVLTADAKVAWIDWHDTLGRQMDEARHTRLFGWLSKAIAMTARIALVLAAMRGACLTDEEIRALPSTGDAGLDDILGEVGTYEIHRNLEVDVEDIRGAIQLIEYFKSTYLKVDHIIHRGALRQEISAILDWIRRRRCTEFREGGRGGLLDDVRWLKRDKVAFRGAIEELIEMNVIRRKCVDEAPAKRGRPPSPAYEVNPAIHANPADLDSTENYENYEG
jgi:hypothetical protein